VDEDQSALSKEVFNAFYPPRFQDPAYIGASAMQDAMDRAGTCSSCPSPRFERDLRAGRNPPSR
jgi:ABC-2 type transport system permease protein